MAEAISSIAQIPAIRITTAAHVLAQLRARQAVKRERPRTTPPARSRCLRANISAIIEAS